MRVYIAGPYTHGSWGENVRNAIEAAEAVWESGHVPFIPHTMTSLWSLLVDRTGHEWLEYDIEWLKKCDALIRISGYSEGSDTEVEFCENHGIPVYYSVEEFLDDKN